MKKTLFVLLITLFVSSVSLAADPVTIEDYDALIAKLVRLDQDVNGQITVWTEIVNYAYKKKFEAEALREKIGAEYQKADAARKKLQAPKVKDAK